MATKVQFSGKFRQPDIEAWDAIIELLKNGFIKALLPRLDLTIDLENVESPATQRKTL